MKKNKMSQVLFMAGFLCLMCGCQSKNDKEAIATVSETTSIEETLVEETSQEELSMTEETESSLQVETEQDEESKKPEPVKVKGIYVSGPVAGTERMDELIALVDETELNAMVIDIKNDEGRITYKMQTDTVTKIEAGIGYISDIEALVKKCKEKDIYLIARVVAFKDPYLAEKCPELAIKKKNGEIFKDKSGLSWVNPYEKKVWEYLIEVSKEAANVGFDEIQFDYIRFSTDLKSDQLDFGPEAENKTKTEIITEFTKYACEELEEMNVYVAADVYGTVIDSKVDQKIVGQDYVEMSSYLDYICPMVYPSHYANGVYGIGIPDAEPYKTIYAAMNAATKELSVLPEEQRAINRVWLQSFTASWVKGYISYGPQQIREQIHGAYDAGYDEWILWNASVRYQRDSLLTDEEAQAEQEAWKEKRKQAEAQKPKEKEQIETQESEENQQIETQELEENQQIETQESEENQQIETQESGENQQVETQESKEDEQIETQEITISHDREE